MLGQEFVLGHLNNNCIMLYSVLDNILLDLLCSHILFHHGYW